MPRNCQHLCCTVTLRHSRPLRSTHTQKPALSIAECSLQDRNPPDPWTRFLVYQAPYLQKHGPAYVSWCNQPAVSRQPGCKCAFAAKSSLQSIISFGLCVSEATPMATVNIIIMLSQLSSNELLQAQSMAALLACECHEPSDGDAQAADLHVVHNVIRKA